MTWHKWFLPHRDTHQKAHLISWEALLIYLLLFVILKSSLSILGYSKPGILGTTSSITQQKIIELTNVQRAKNGLSPLVENHNLDQAAESKAANMFQENYWAHFAPSGKSPWDFISGSGYKFQYAGENLAKNFTNSDDVVTAWMASPSHRDNIVNSHYRDIGISVEDGVLNGVRTTLVVQMFGSTSGLAEVQPTNPPLSLAESEPKAIVNVSGEQKVAPPLFDPFQVTKSFGLGVIGLVSTLLIVDFLILRRRGVFRLSSHHLAHLSLLGVAAATLISASGGRIL